jgi:hypothetical protein
VSNPDRDNTKSPHRLWGPPTLLFSGYRVPPPGMKLRGLIIYHSHPSIAEVKNEWSHTSTVLYLSRLQGSKVF